MPDANPIVEFLGTLPQFAVSRRGNQLIHLKTGCIVDDAFSASGMHDVHMFTLRLRWPGPAGHIEHLVEANRYVEFQLLEAQQFGIEICGLRKIAERAFNDVANARSPEGSVE